MTPKKPHFSEARASALAAADARMVQAKQRFSAAALACLRCAPDAAARVKDALSEIDEARATLRAAASTDGPFVVVVRTDRQRNVTVHDEVHAAVGAAIG